MGKSILSEVQLYIDWKKIDGHDWRLNDQSTGQLIAWISVFTRPVKNQQIGLMSKDTPDNHFSVAAVQQCFAPPCVHSIHYYAFYQLCCGIVKNVQIL